MQHRKKNNKKYRQKIIKATKASEGLFTLVESSVDAFFSMFNPTNSGKKKYYRVYKQR